MSTTKTKSRLLKEHDVAQRLSLSLNHSAHAPNGRRSRLVQNQRIGALLRGRSGRLSWVPTKARRSQLKAVGKYAQFETHDQAYRLFALG